MDFTSEIGPKPVSQAEILASSEAAADLQTGIPNIAQEANQATHPVLSNLLHKKLSF